MDENGKLPQRKPNRLKFYDYSKPGAYFITICTKDRKNFFWQNVGATIGRPRDVILSPYGEIADRAIHIIPEKYPMVTVDYYTIMPNHIHLLLQIHQTNISGDTENGRPMVAPTTDRIIQQMKGYVSKQIRQSIWQKLFHDHVVRGRNQYMQIAKYICENPTRWQFDCFYNTDVLRQ